MTDTPCSDDGACELSVAGLSVTVVSRHGEDSDDYWDGNWLQAAAEYRSGNSRVSVTGSIIHLSEIAAFKAGCERMMAGEIDETGLYCREPNLKVELWRVPNGQLIGKARITPDHKSELHDFGFALENEDLKRVAAACAAMLEKFPLRGKNKGAW